MRLYRNKVTCSCFFERKYVEFCILLSYNVNTNCKGVKGMKTSDKKKMWIVAIVTLLIYFIGVGFFGIYTKDMEYVYYFSQIFSAIFVVLGVVVAMLQYLISSSEQSRARERELEIRERELLEIEKDRIQNAINLASYYKDNILDNIAIIDSIYEDTGIKDILENMSLEDIKEFDQHELKVLLNTDTRKRIEEIVNSKEFEEAIAKNSIIYGFGEKAKFTTTTTDENGRILGTVNINKMEMFREYANILMMLLNNIEYFAMNFTHETADESVVYQSLHSTYLSIMRILYFDNAQNNEIGEEKLYTNAIDLFNIWRDKATMQRKDGIERQRSTVEKGSALKISQKG